MRRYSKIKSSVYAPVTTNCISQHQAFLQMSNHYRRVYSAKKCVDTSAPQTYKQQNKQLTSSKCQYASSIEPESPSSTKSASSSEPSASELDLVDRILRDSKHSPIAYVMEENGDSVHAQTDIGCSETISKKCRKQLYTSVQCPRAKIKNPVTAETQLIRKGRRFPPLDLIDQHREYFISEATPHRPRILKTEGKSRIRDLRVYHPPRRRFIAKPQNNSVESEKEDEESPASPDVPHLEIEPDSDQEEWLAEQASRGEARQRAARLLSNAGSIKASSSIAPLLSRTSSGKESSKDSAYNGGISSGESRGPTRGPTPEQGVGAALLHKAPPFTAEKEGKSDEAYSKLPRQPQEKKIDDIKYLKFLKEVTQDILVRDVYTNRSLKHIFQSHIDANRGKLDTDHMLMLIERLSIDLGIPKDDSLDSLNYGLGYVNSKSKLSVFDSESGKGLSISQPTSASKFSLQSQHDLEYSKASKTKPSWKASQERVLLDIKEQDLSSSGGGVGEDDLSICEDEALRTLKEVGFDSSMASDIWNVLKKNDASGNNHETDVKTVVEYSCTQNNSPQNTGEGTNESDYSEPEEETTDSEDENDNE